MFVDVGIFVQGERDRLPGCQPLPEIVTVSPGA